MSGERRGKKRPKSYYLKCAAGGKKFQRANDLATGMKGFIVTCNKYERETVREMYNILNEYADQMYGPEINPEELANSDNDTDEEEDMEKAMARETSAMKEAGKKEKRFQNTDTKTKNCIFIRTTVEDPSKLAHKIFSDIVEQQTQKMRYALRMLPINITCKAKMENIKVAGEAILKPHFETEFGVGLTYTVVCKIRNNQSIGKAGIQSDLGKIIHELNPLHRVNFGEPDLVILVEVIRNVACLSVVKDYYKFKKYNFHEVLVKKDGASDVTVSVKREEGSDEIATEAAGKITSASKADEIATEAAEQDAGTNKAEETATVSAAEESEDAKKSDETAPVSLSAKEELEDAKKADETVKPAAKEDTEEVESTDSVEGEKQTG